MSDETKTAGTPEPEDADALEQPGTSGTPGTEDRDAESREPDYKALYLGSKDKIEEANRLKERVAELESRTEPSPAALGADPNARVNELRRKAKAFADGGDPVAALQFEQQAEIAQLKQDIFDLRTLDKIPDEAKQKKVLQHYERNRTRLGDIKAAQAEVDAEEYGAENKRLREQLETLTRKPDPDVVNAVTTHGRGGGERVTPKEMTEDQFDKESARIRAEKGELAEMKYQRENAARVR